MNEEFGERGEIQLLREVLEESRKQTRLLREIRDEEKLKLSAIEIRFGGDMQGPITLTPAAPSTVATVLGFDQTGAPWTGAMPAVTYTPDVTTFCTFAVSADGTSDSITGTADGTTNFAASLTTVEGLALSDTSQVITSGFTGTAPVLSSIKLDFNPPNTPLAARRR